MLSGEPRWATPDNMKNKTLQQSSRKASQGRGERVSTGAPESTRCQVIKLGIDVHAGNYVVVRQMDNATPQPAQRFAPEQLDTFVARRRES